MITLPHNLPIQTALANGWQQVSFSLTLPFTLEVGTRLALGHTLLAPWRINGQHIDCLVQPNDAAIDLTQSITLTHQGQALPHIAADQALLITGENLGIADAILSASLLKHQAEQTLVLLSAESFPCVIKPARFMVSTLPQAIAACPLLEDWGFANRLINDQLPGCLPTPIAQWTKQLPYKQQLVFTSDHAKH